MTERVILQDRGMCSNKTILLNLVIMSMLWAVTALNYYEIAYYMKYVPGNLFINTSASCVAELSAYFASGVMY